MLAVHPDLPGGVRALSKLGILLVTSSNGSASIARRLLADAGLDHALEARQVDPMDATLVAVHPWDTDGASRAGLASAWINRSGGRYPEYFRPPDLLAGSLLHVAAQLK